MTAWSRATSSASYSEFTPRQVLSAFLAEALVLSTFGAGLGVMLSLITPFLNFTTPNIANGQATAFSASLQRRVCSSGRSPRAFWSDSSAAFFPALRAARVSPVQAMRA